MCCVTEDIVSKKVAGYVRYDYNTIPCVHFTDT